MSSDNQSQTVGIYMLGEQHVDALQRLASDEAIAATTRIPHPYPEGAARQFVEHMFAERNAGRAYVFAIEDNGTFVGAIGLHGVEMVDKPTRARELGFWIGRPYWGKQYATLALKQALEFAFTNLRLDEVFASAFETNVGSRRVLEKNGAELMEIAAHDDSMLKDPNVLLAHYRMTRAGWLARKSAKVFASLHPSLHGIVKAELAAGNEVSDSRKGWPDSDSVFVQLAKPFIVKHAKLPDGVRFSEGNDPHWWRADYSTKSPRHIVAC